MILGMLVVLATTFAGPLDNVPGGGGNGKVTVKNCKNGENVTLEGTGSAVTYQGSCGVVTIKGQGNVVTVASLTKLVATGAGHQVQYVTNASDQPALPTELENCPGCIVKKVKRL